MNRIGPTRMFERRLQPRRLDLGERRMAAMAVGRDDPHRSEHAGAAQCVRSASVRRRTAASATSMAVCVLERYRSQSMVPCAHRSSPRIHDTNTCHAEPVDVAVDDEHPGRLRLGEIGLDRRHDALTDASHPRRVRHGAQRGQDRPPHVPSGIDGFVERGEQHTSAHRSDRPPAVRRARTPTGRGRC